MSRLPIGSLPGFTVFFRHKSVIAAAFHCLLLACWLLRCACAQAPVPTVSPSAVQTTAPTSAPPASLTGEVRDQARRPIARALVRLDSGQSALSATDGSFRVEGIPAGPHYVSVSAPGHHLGGKTIDFVSGQSQSLYVQLTANNVVPGGGAEHRHGTFYVYAHPFERGRDHFRVKYIEVYQSDAPFHHWYNDQGEDGMYLTCSDAVLGADYVIHVGWRARIRKDGYDPGDFRTGEYYRRFNTGMETMDIWEP